jgi:hypothetical protein
MTIEQHERAIWHFASDTGIGNSYLGQNSPQGVSLFLRMRSPVLGVWPELTGRDSAKLFNPVSNLHEIPLPPQLSFNERFDLP